MNPILSTHIKETIATYAPLSEEGGALHEELLKLAYAHNWFKLFVPAVYGGPGLQLPEILKLEEALAAADGSLGWTVTLCSGAGWFAGFLDPDLAAELFAEPEVCFAGSGAVGGTAVDCGDGYLVQGEWNYASGASHATVFTANCTMQDAEGNTIITVDGKPQVRSFILKRDEVTVVSGWSYFGLVATGSHAFTVDQVKVPLNRTFEINKEIQLEGQGFDYPFLQLAETTLAVNSLGMAQHFLQLVQSSFSRRSGQKRYTTEQIAFFGTVFQRCHEELESLRTAFYGIFEQSWQELLKGMISDETLLDVSRISRELAHCARRVADELFPYCGLEAAKKETEINRVWRDLHTASQHSLLTFV